MSHWNLENIPWKQFDAQKVNDRLLALAKGASLVESNAADYVTYLRQVFSDDGHFLDEIERWGHEEKLHGDALRRWCEMADPQFDFDGAMQRFLKAYRVPLEATSSVRGSRSRELVARCVVETGTTTFYMSLRDGAEEPVLKEICRRIAGDEVRHFQLFLNELNDKYADLDGIGFLDRCKTISERVTEVTDAELTFAYFAANAGPHFDPVRLPEYSQFYMGETAHFFKRKHLESSIPMIGKLVGMKVRPWLTAPLSGLLHKSFQMKYGKAYPV